MGNCVTNTNRTHGRNNAVISVNDEGHEQLEPAQKWGMGMKNRGALQSMIRVGSHVFKADPIESHDCKLNGGTNGNLEEHKASTYDHVHQMVR